MSFNIKNGNSVVTGDFSALEKLIEELEAGYYVDIGILGGERTEDEEITIAGIGAVHEFGRLDGTIPERSFIRMPLEKMGPRIAENVEPHLEEKLAEGDIKVLFKIIGIAGEEQIQAAFESRGFGLWPDIQEKTKERKGSSAVLIDDGTMRKAITSRVGKV